MALGISQILIIGGVAVFLFGGSKVIEWAKSLGEAKNEYEKALKGDKNKKN